jgi:hypothetical protein
VHVDVSLQIEFCGETFATGVAVVDGLGRKGSLTKSLG